MPGAADFRGWAGRSHGWRYLAQRIDGTGTPGVFLDNELPLSAVRLTDVLSGPPQLTATITPVVARELGINPTMDEPTILREKGTLIHAEADGVIRGSFLLMGAGFSGPTLSLDASGVTTVAKGLGYPGAVQFVEVDPLDIVRHIWVTIQADPDSNIRLAVDASTRTGLKVGKNPEPPPAATATGTASQSSATPQTSQTEDEKPVELNWWSTHDLGGEIDKLCADHSIEYRERHAWNADRTDVLHYLDFGYPSLGYRRDLRFVLGENVQRMPDLDRDGDEFANHVLVLGAGEGSEMVRGEARRRDGRVRTMAVVDDKSITDPAIAVRVARLELARRQQLTQIASVVVRHTSMAPIGSFGVGDEIRVQGMTDWSAFDVWARILKMTIDPDVPDAMVVDLERTDWVTS